MLKQTVTCGIDLFDKNNQNRGGGTMFQHINNIIRDFLCCFKRTETWQWFAIIVMGFIVRRGDRGITLVISALKLDPELYHTMLHFFRSKAYEVGCLYERWIEVAQREIEFVKVAGRVILLGDHIKIPKEGRRMPGIQIVHQESENSGKGEYIEGHIHAQVSAVVSKEGNSRSLPLRTERQQSPPKIEGTKKPDGDTLVTQMLNLVVVVMKSIKNATATVALDAYFAKASAFMAIDKCVDENGARRLEIVTRGRDDTVGYMPPCPRPKGKRGRPPKYGSKVSLWNLFADMGRFSEATLTLYGKPTKVQYRCLDLTWKPLDRVVRFVVVSSSLGKMILLCSDLNINPEDAITIFCLRFKIETSFDEQKNHNGGFAYRFWTKYLEKRKRWTNNSQPKDPNPPKQVVDAKRAIEVYLCMSTISAGILTIIAFAHNRQIWGRFPGWIKTRRTSIPSIAVTKETLAQDFPVFLKKYPHLPLCFIINARHRSIDFLYEDVV